MNDLKLNDFINALKILYKYIKFREKINEIFPNFNIQTLRYINIYNFDDILKLIFANVKVKDKDVDKVLEEIKNDFGDLSFNELKNCVNIIRQFYTIDRYIIHGLNQLVSMSGFNINTMLDFIKVKSSEKEESKEVIEEEDKDKEIKIDKHKLDLILNNKV